MTIVFDLDGTLIDSAQDLAESASELVAEYGAPPLAPAEVVGMVGEGAAVLVARALTRSNLDPATPEALNRFLEIYDRRLLDHTRPYPGIPEVLAALVCRGPLAVLTNKPTSPSEQILEALGLRGFFVRVIGGDGPYPRKPDPAGLLSLCGSEKEKVLMVGDSPVDYQTAMHAGAVAVVARYGFGIERFGGVLPDDARPIDHPRELIPLVETITLEAARVPIVTR